MTKIKTDLNLIALDIETAPALVWSFGLFNQNHGIDQIEEDPYILGFSVQRYGKPVKWYDCRDEKTMYDELFKALDEADVLVGWNSDSFDVKWIEGELKLRGYPAPSPTHLVDLMKHFRRRSRFISKKLAYVSQRLLGDTKVPHQGFRDLWWPIISPKATEEERNKAWTRMKRYGLKDTALMFPILEEVIGWIKLPVRMRSNPYEETCPNCGSTHVRRKGYRRSGNFDKQRYQCQNDGCGKWWTERVGIRISETSITS